MSVGENAQNTMAIQVCRVASVVAAYWTTSISMVFANKYLVGERHTDDISLFVSWFQCIMTVLLVAGFKAARGWRRDNWLTVDQLRTIMFSRHVLAMSGFFVGMLSFNNMCLKLVGVSFYQVLNTTVAATATSIQLPLFHMSKYVSLMYYSETIFLAASSGKYLYAPCLDERCHSAFGSHFLSY